MKQVLHWLCQIRSAMAGSILSAIAAKRPHHPQAFEKAHLRIVTLEHRGAKAASMREEVWQALLLLAQHEPAQMRRIAKHIRTIFIAAVVRGGAYVQAGQICVLNLNRLPSTYSHRDRVIAIAALLVHEATHAVFSDHGVPYCGRTAARVEYVCETVQARVLEKLNQVATI